MLLKHALHFHKLSEAAGSTLILSPDGYPEPEELPRRYSYFSISQIYGLAAVLTTNEDEEVVVSLYALVDLRKTLRESTGKKAGKVGREKVKVGLGVDGFAGGDATVDFVKFANGDRDLLVATLDGRIFVFSIKEILSNPSAARPRHCFPSSSSTSGIILDLLPNPSPTEPLLNIAGIITESGDVRLLDLAHLQEVPAQGNLSGGLGATTACWSPVGKQLAVGTRNGCVVAVTPEGVAKTVFGPLPNQPGNLAGTSRDRPSHFFLPLTIRVRSFERRLPRSERDRRHLRRNRFRLTSPHLRGGPDPFNLHPHLPLRPVYRARIRQLTSRPNVPTLVTRFWWVQEPHLRLPFRGF